ncbi:MAG: transcriptional repressor [Porticoccaceae bacterium]|nr:transcriptional repressor [Porticoccaceae bacterium]
MITNSKVAYRQHDHLRCQNAALHQAQALCARDGARLTPIRETVLRLIWQSHRPLGAYDIIEQLSESSAKRVMPPTVYRALDFLLTQGLIHRLATLNAYIGCPFPGSAHSNVFMVCRVCGSAAECSVDAINKAIVAAASRSGFVIESQSIEVSGLCPACQDGELSSDDLLQDAGATQDSVS